MKRKSDPKYEQLSFDLAAFREAFLAAINKNPYPQKHPIYPDKNNVTEDIDYEIVEPKQLPPPCDTETA